MLQNLVDIGGVFILKIGGRGCMLIVKLTFSFVIPYICFFFYFLPVPLILQTIFKICGEHYVKWQDFKFICHCNSVVQGWNFLCNLR